MDNELNNKNDSGKNECNVNVSKNVRQWKSQPPHPDCKMTFDELVKMSNCLSKPKQDKFLSKTFLRGENPHLLLENMLKLVPSQEIGYAEGTTNPKRGRGGLYGNVGYYPGRTPRGSFSGLQRATKYKYFKGGPPVSDRGGFSGRPGRRSRPYRGAHSGLSRQELLAKNFQQQCQRLINTFEQFGDPGHGITPMPLPENEDFHNPDLGPDNHTSFTQEPFSSDAPENDNPLKEQCDRFLSNVNIIGGIGNVNLDLPGINPPNDVGTPCPSGQERANIQHPQVGPNSSTSGKQGPPPPGKEHDSSGAFPKRIRRRHHNCKMSKAKLRQMATGKLINVTRFVCIAFYDGKEPFQLLEQLMMEEKMGGVHGSDGAQIANHPPTTGPASPQIGTSGPRGGPNQRESWQGPGPSFGNGPRPKMPPSGNGPPGNVTPFKNAPASIRKPFGRGAPANVPPVNNAPASIRQPFGRGAPANVPPVNNAPASISHPFAHGAPANVPPVNNAPASSSHPFVHGAPANVPPVNNAPASSSHPFVHGAPANVPLFNNSPASIRHPLNHGAPFSVPPPTHAPATTSHPFHHEVPTIVPPPTNAPASTSQFNYGPHGNVPPFNTGLPGNIIPFSGGHDANSQPMSVGLHPHGGSVASFSGGHSNNVQPTYQDQRGSTELLIAPPYSHPPPIPQNMAHNVDKYPNIAPQQENCSTDLDEDPTTPLFIVPTGYPGERFSDQEMDVIESGILEAILEIDDDSLKPTFKESLRDNGRYGVICNDHLSKTWLFNFLTSWRPWQCASFKVVKSEPPKLKAFAKLPLCANDEDGKILKFIAKQNSNLNVSQWEVIRRMDSETSTCLILYIDEESAKLLVKDRTINFKIGRAEIIVEGGFKGDNAAGRTLNQQRQESEDQLSRRDRDEQPPLVQQRGLGQNPRGPSSSDQRHHFDELSQEHYSRPPKNSFSKRKRGLSDERMRNDRFSRDCSPERLGGCRYSPSSSPEYRPYSPDSSPELPEHRRFGSPTRDSFSSRYRPSFEERMRQPEYKQRQNPFPASSGYNDFERSPSPSH